MPSPLRHARTGVGAALVAACLVVTLPGGGFAQGASPPAGPRTIVVRSDRGGDTGSIAEAVAMAAPGDTVLVHPGRYPTSVRVDKDITLRGVGDPASVVLVVPTDASEPPDIADGGDFGYGLFLDDTRATIANLTVLGLEFGFAVVVRGGAPVLEDLHLPLRGEFRGTFTRPHTALVLEQGTTAVLRRVDAVGWLDIHTGATPTILESHFPETCMLIAGAGTAPVLADASIIGCPYGWAVEVADGAAATFLGGTITSPTGPALTVRGTDSSSVLRGVRIIASQIGISTVAGASVTVEASTIDANGSGAVLRGTGSGSVIRNTSITGSTGQGVTVLQGGSPTLERVTITGNGVGLSIVGAQSTPSLVAVTICGNGQNVDLALDATMPANPDSTICPDPADTAP